MIKVKFVLNRFGWDPAPNQGAIESLSIIQDIDPAHLPDLRDIVPVTYPEWAKPVVRSRTNLVLIKDFALPKKDGLHYIVEMKCEDKSLFTHLRNNGWK
ncbi:MAG TPA: hypothetical protein VN665_01035 [Candidatus Paceibacterota bacterium]|nr:hypothetical protein [Candidatus Paceibacterota bacterium]